jgi:hypothetical protein
MKVGDRVRVKESVVVYHHPEHKGRSVDIRGTEGEVLSPNGMGDLLVLTSRF